MARRRLSRSHRHGAGKRGEFLMANGRAATLEPHDPLAGEAYLAIGEIVGRAAAARVVAAAPLTLAEIEAVAGGAIETREETAFDRASASLRARRRRRLGALTLAEGSLSPPADEQARWRWRAEFSISGRRACRGPSRWRNGAGGSISCAAPKASLGPTLPTRRSPLRPTGWRRSCSARRGSTRLSSDELGQALHALLPYELQRRLEAEAPSHYVAPTGTAAPVDYEAEGGPSVALRVQELFGLSVHPALAGGRVPLTLHLLSPAHRPIQITRDLPGFWKGSWAGVRADLRGRYPRHFWPEDPANATPTSRAKPRGT